MMDAVNGITVEAHAKINLTLDIIGKREDGYHEVEMVMQTIGLHDTVTVTRRQDERICMTIGFEEGYRAPAELLKADADNLCVRAARLVCEAGGLENGYDIALTKRIPVGAGLAGGSTDAAAVLHAVNALEGLHFSMERLCEMGASLGSDIPYCCMGGTYFATGTGTTLTRLEPCPPLWMILLKPEVSMPTGRIYHDYDGAEHPFHPDNEKMRRALEEGSPAKVAMALGNSLEPVVTAEYPIIADLKKALCGAGAMNAVMTGSGSCVYGIFEGKEAVEDAVGQLRKEYPDLFLCASMTYCP